ncbi:hypothetical protein [Streptomyces atratus]|uniref:hypothetical protein n=1 Tax=Streptomyces atratus TaxID=1893 RepID=UPI0022588794|nr:hypothetical protein [Streptomyces atratus]MCX5344988.1 hypothetical protein [Streptomyces atratus]
MPPRPTAEFTRIRDELGDFPGRTVDAARLRAMLANPARTYYPGVLNDCCFEASTALCLSRRPSAEPEAAPVMNHCQPAKCPNSCALPRHRPAIDNVIGDARQLLTIHPLTSLRKTALHQADGADAAHARPGRGARPMGGHGPPLGRRSAAQ